MLRNDFDSFIQNKSYTIYFAQFITQKRVACTTLDAYVLMTNAQIFERLSSFV
jgi:hypothetical protein